MATEMKKRRAGLAGFRLFGAQDTQRLTREYMQERYGWVSDPTHPAYVAKYGQTLEVMEYMRERELLAVRALRARTNEQARMTIRIEKRKGEQ
jgi:predicted metal-dependent HD superfamily phosphohydrolase